MTEKIPDQGPGTVLCRLDDIGDPGSKEILIEGRESFFVVRLGGAVFGYINRCPHLGVPMDWKQDTFLTFDKTQIQCTTHGARFRIEDGFCTAGPCERQSLKPVAVRVEDGAVVLGE